MRITAGDFTVASCLATAFTPDGEISVTQFLTRLVPSWSGRFDAEPSLVSLPDGMPKEIPLVILRSKSEQWRCEVAAGRINVSWRRVSTRDGAMTAAQAYAEAIPLI